MIHVFDLCVRICAIQLHVEKHKTLLRRKLDPGMKKQIENQKFWFSIIFKSQDSFSLLSNFFMFFNMKLRLKLAHAHDRTFSNGPKTVLKSDADADKGPTCPRC